MNRKMFFAQNINFSPESTTIHGRLYNWYAVNNFLFPPIGWHIPTDDEIKTLEISVGMSVSESNKIGFRGTNEGSKLSGRSDLWIDGALDSNIDFGISGFKLPPSGNRYYENGVFIGLLDNVTIWSNSEYDVNLAWIRFITSSNSKIYRLYFTKKYGHSVRFIKDSTTLTNGQTSTMNDNDGNVVKTICIGNQEWTSENCKQTKYNNGTNIPFEGINDGYFTNSEWAALTSPGVCAYANNESYV